MDCTPPNNTDNRDYVELSEVVSWRNSWLILGLVVLTTAAVAVGGVLTFKYAKKVRVIQAPVTTTLDPSQLQAVSDPVTTSNPVATSGPITQTTENAKPTPLVATVRLKDNLSKIFKRNKLDAKSAVAILALKAAQPLKNLQTGKELRLLLDPTRTKVQELTYEIDPLDTLIITAQGNSWSAKTKHVDPIVTTKYATATVHGSIYAAAKHAGVSYKLMTKLINAFGNRVSVSKIRDGDSFSLFYKEHTVNNKPIKDSEIAAAELIHKGHSYRIVGFTDSHGITNFYTPEGHSIKPAFIRYPMTAFKRISSHFSWARKHPILAETRPHLGVDFAANTGSPVKATCNGKVVFVGVRNGHGRTIILKNGIYTALYAHLSGFAKNVQVGSYVKQEQVIGYVGSSGLSTSPHLHYEFHINGVPKDPLKVRLPAGEMIAPEQRHRFLAQAKTMMAKLDLYSKSHRVFAMNYMPKFE